MAIRQAGRRNGVRVSVWAGGARVRAKFLGEWEGILQTDGYQAYDDIGGPKLVHVGCWAHARRKFVDAVKVNPQDGAAITMVTRMDALFLIDRHARQQQLSAEERLALRREHAADVGARDSAECLALRAQRRCRRARWAKRWPTP